MRRGILIGASLYLGAALGTRTAEAAGMQRCHCSSACWCRRILSGFRWVAPTAHR